MVAIIISLTNFFIHIKNIIISFNKEQTALHIGCQKNYHQIVKISPSITMKFARNTIIFNLFMVLIIIILGQKRNNKVSFHQTHIGEKN